MSDKQDFIPAVGLADVLLSEGWDPEAEAAATRSIDSEHGRPGSPSRLLLRADGPYIHFIDRAGVPLFSFGRDELPTLIEALETFRGNVQFSALEMLEQWQAGDKNRTTEIEHDDGFGANGGWNIRLTAGPNLSYWVNEGILMTKSICGDWCGLDYLIKYAITEIEKL